METLRYEGCCQFRQRIVAATLSRKRLRIDKIRDRDENPGLHDFEASFLRLIEKLTDGCSIEINETGTSLRYKPGLITGGKLSHDCGNARSIGWFVEGILPLAAFGKENLQATFTGITNDGLDLSVDLLRNVTLPFLRNFGIEGASMKIKKRGAAPGGGGAVDFFSPLARQLKSINITDAGLIKRVRGVVFCARISPTIITRVIDTARGVLNNFLPDVYIHSDHYKGAEGGKSPGYSLSLVAETTTGVLISAERTAGEEQSIGDAAASVTGSGAGSGSGSSGRPELPETVGEEGAWRLLDEVRRGGVIDSVHQPLILQMMVLTPEDVSKVRFGELTDQAVESLRLIRDAFGVTFKIKDAEDDNGVSNVEKRQRRAEPGDDDDDEADVELGRTLFLSCVGSGYVNMARRAT